MNLILLEKQECVDNKVILTDHRATHIVKVINAKVGETLKVGVIDGMIGRGNIYQLEKKRPHKVCLTLRLKKNEKEIPKIDLILALPRPIMLKRILSQVTALGIGRIFLINANRVEKSFWGASILEPEEHKKHLLTGLEQCVDTRVPEVSIHNKFRPFVEDFLPSIMNNYEHQIVAHPDGTVLLNEGITNKNGRILLAVGPEGGWVDFEVTKFHEQGFTSCSMGDRILKVDTAVIALHSYISALLES